MDAVSFAEALFLQGPAIQQGLEPGVKATDADFTPESRRFTCLTTSAPLCFAGRSKLK